MRMDIFLKLSNESTHFHNSSYCNRLKISCDLQEIIIDYMQHYEEERYSAFDIEGFAMSCHVPAGWGLQQTTQAPGNDTGPGILWSIHRWTKPNT